MAFNVSIFMKHANDHWHNVETFYTEFHQIWQRNLELTGRKVFYVRKQMVSHRTDFYATLARQLVVVLP